MTYFVGQPDRGVLNKWAIVLHLKFQPYIFL